MSKYTGENAGDRVAHSQQSVRMNFFEAQSVESIDYSHNKFK